MAFKFRDFLGKTLTAEVDTVTEETINELYLKELAINSAINIIAKMMSSCKIKTFIENEEVKNHMYYLLNVEPNQNENATQFYFHLFQKLIYENEALVISENNYIYIADSYDTTDKVFYDSYFKNVTIDELTLTQKTYFMSDVLFFKLNNKKIKQLIDGLYETYGKLYTSATDSFRKSRGVRGKYKIPVNWSQKYKDQSQLQEVIRNKFKSYFSSDNAVLPIEDGFDFTEMGESTKKNTSSSDVTEIIDKCFDVVAIAFNMPAGILKGNISQNKEIMDSIMTLNIKPYARMIENEINRKFYGEEAFLKGSRVKVDITNVQYSNIIDSANAIDILFRDGFSHNEIMNRFDEETLNEEWANEHFITKNYMSVQEMLKNGKEEK